MTEPTTHQSCMIFEPLGIRFSNAPGNVTTKVKLCSVQMPHSHLPSYVSTWDICNDLKPRLGTGRFPGHRKEFNEARLKMDRSRAASILPMTYYDYKSRILFQQHLSVAPDCEFFG